MGDGGSLNFGPIFARELLTTPRRVRHYVLRATCVGLLFVLMWTAWQTLVGFQLVERLGDIAQFNVVLFQVFSYTQLTMVMFAAALFGASSVSYEKDRRTFILLLVTRLKDWEIIFEKFLCGFLQVGSMLLATFPVFIFTALLGGIGFGQIIEVYAVTVGSAILSGATGVLIATWREKTFQAVSMSMLAIVLALLCVEVFSAAGKEKSFGSLALKDIGPALSSFRAIEAAIVSPGEKRPWFLFGRPSSTYPVLVTAMGFLYLVIASVKMRTWNPRGEPIQEKEDEKTAVGATPAKKRDPFRHVWDNPVLWREIMTRAYGTKTALIKLAYLGTLVIVTWGLINAHPSADDPRLHLILARSIVPAAIISLMLVNTQSVTALTSERDLNSLTLLLATDVTAKEFVFGKMMGMLYNAKEMVLGPLLLMLGCTIAGLISPIQFGYAAVLYSVFVTFVCILGIHSGLRYESSRAALANSMGTAFLLFIGILICMLLILVSGRFEQQWSSFLLFIVIGSLALWISLRANAPSNAIGLTASILPISTFYCVIAFLVGDRGIPFMVATAVYGFAISSLLIPLVDEFDVATGRTTAEGG